jgi:uncharacterized membrane-anchored protein
MTTPHVPDWMDEARQQGLLAPKAGLPAPGRPWPVQLLSALGAWLAVIPLLFFLALFFERAWRHGPTAYLVGGALLGAALIILRQERAGQFLEQLALPLLLLGVCSVGYAFGRDLPYRGALAASLAVCAGLVVALPRHWLRLVIGMAGSWLCMALVPGGQWGVGMVALWWAIYLALGVWAVAQAWVHAQGLQAGGAANAALLEPVLRGWALGLLPALAWLSGPSFMMAGALGSGLARELHGAFGQSLWQADRMGPALLSVLSAGLAQALLARAWPALGRPRLWVPAVLLMGLAWVLPALGASLLILSLAVVRGRRVLALSAAATGLWVLGSFYYQLNLPLTDKALILAAAGVLLGAWLWFTRERPAAAAPSPASPPDPGARAVALCALLALGLVNGLIWQKETLIAEGRPVFVSLAPIDPRSLIQGDYMRMAYALPPTPEVEGLIGPWQRRPRVEAAVDARGVLGPARLLRPDDTPTPGLQVLELSPVNGRWTLVRDAWYFAEGQEPVYRTAAYGEFRVMPDGRALLVGLVDKDLRRLP